MLDDLHLSQLGGYPRPDLRAAFRSIELQLPDLDPGEYTLHLRLELAGREPVVTSRPIIVE